MKPSKSSASGAYDLLLDAIETGALPAGTRLREVDLAARFAISRTPVREALKRLESQGLVTHEPHHGATVTALDYGQVAELYHMRAVLDGAAAALAAAHATATEIEVLREMVERDRALAEMPKDLARTNRLFHRHLLNAARNRFLNTMGENLRVSLALLAGTTLVLPGRGAESVAEHDAIVRAIEAHDPERAEQAARLHIRHAFKARITLPAQD